MNSNSKKSTGASGDKKSPRGSRVPWWLVLVIGLIYEYSLVWAGAIIVLFIVAVFTDDLFTYDGILFALGTSAFIVLYILKRRLDKLDDL